MDGFLCIILLSPLRLSSFPLSALLGVWIFRDMTADRRGCFDRGSFDILMLVWGMFSLDIL